MKHLTELEIKKLKGEERMQSKVNNCKELLVYNRFNDVNKEWVDERVEIILEHVTNPSKDAVTAAFKEAVKQCREIWIPINKEV